MVEDISIQTKAVLRVLIIRPTRELAIQVYKSAIDLLRHLPKPRAVVLYGGTSMPLDLDHLDHGCQILIATPCSRVLAHTRKANPRLSLALVGFYILDEAKCLLQPDLDEQLGELNKLTETCCVDANCWLFTFGFDKDETLKAKSIFTAEPTKNEKDSDDLAQGCLRIKGPLATNACAHAKPEIIDVTGKDPIEWLRDWLLYNDTKTQRVLILADKFIMQKQPIKNYIYIGMRVLHFRAGTTNRDNVRQQSTVSSTGRL